MDAGHEQLAKAGFRLAKRYLPELVEGTKQHLLPLVNDPQAASVAPSIRRSQRAASPEEVLNNHAGMFQEVLPWMLPKQGIFRGIFQGKAAQGARQLANAVQEESPAAFLNKAANIMPVSGLRVPVKWIAEAAAATGSPLTSTEQVMLDGKQAKELGEKLRNIETALGVTTPNTPVYAQLEEMRTEALARIEEMAQDSESPDTVRALAASAQPTQEHATETGRKLGHTPDQEAAMMVEGRAIIAAGAGSGKTRVLASKVAYHINEKGVDPAAILATTFTRKAAGELKKRVADYGAVIEGAAADNFGTTHSIAGKLLNKRATSFKRGNGYIGKNEGWKQVALIRLAMEQVKMRGAVGQPPEPRGLWDGDAVPDAAQVDPGMADYQAAMDEAIGFYQWAATAWGRPWKGRPGNQGAADWAGRQVPILQDLRSTPPGSLTDKQKGLLNRLFQRVRRLNYRVAAKKKDAPADTPEPKKKKKKMKDYVYFGRPAGQWFNLGRELSREVGDVKVGVPLGTFKNAISILKGKGLSPSEAWAGEGPYPAESDETAVYAAYEWLKGPTGEPEYQSMGDMDDILIDTVRALVGSPTLRRQLQGQYKVLLIDEAQDNNKVQHLLFGLMAGYLDPETLSPRADKAMSADTYCLVGDDKQAIYAFRGADPDEFVDKSDLTEGGDDFQTKILDLNFRSGQAIVEGAGRLIAHNSRQVPMVCKANVDKNGTGQLISRFAGDDGEAGVLVAEEIESMMETAQDDAAQYADFGVAVRSNAEAYHYGLEMLKRGIPFKSNARFFNDPNTKALIGWLTVAEHGLDGPAPLMETAVMDATKAPWSKLGKALFNKLLERAGGESWAKYIVDHHGEIYGRGDYKDYLAHFAANLKAVAKMSGSPQEVLGNIMLLKGADGSTMQQAMIRSVMENHDVMAELAAASEGGTPTDEQIEEQALAPVQPLIGLMEGKDELGPAMNFVRKLRAVNDKTTSKDSEEELDRDAVTIGTMHSWKGLECPNMYVPMVGGKFPRCGPEGKAPEGPDLWDERRLAYVAITRAEQRCVVLNIPNPKTGVTSQFLDEACVQIEGMPADGEGQVPKLATWEPAKDELDELMEEGWRIEQELEGGTP